MDDDVQVLDAPPSRGVAARNAIVIPESTSEMSSSSSSANSIDMLQRASSVVTDVQELLEVFPDCDPEFLLRKAQEFERGGRLDSLSNFLLENPYPKKKKPTKSSSKREELTLDDIMNKRFVSVDSGYKTACDNFLAQRFPTLSKHTIRQAQLKHAYQVGPAMLELEKLEEQWPDLLPKIPLQALISGCDIHRYRRRARKVQNQETPSFSTLKGIRPFVPYVATNDLFDRELQVLLVRESTMQQDLDEKLARELNEQEYEESGALIECSCCYEEVPFDDMTSCEDGHVFCKNCAKRAAEAVLANGKWKLNCLQSGCAYHFPRSEVRRFLDDKQFGFYEKRESASELLEADIENLEKCPFCDYAMIIENTEDRIFRCLNKECMKESCRLCKEENHVPLRCDEVESRDVRNYRSHVAEKMTEALIRECPKCHLRFFKTEGCNHMRCPCGLEMCYLCKKVIKGYNHFNSKGAACELYVDTVKKNETDVAAAAKRARVEYETEHTEIKDIAKDIDIIGHGGRSGSENIKRRRV